MIKVVIALLLIFTSAAASAQSGITRASTSPYEKQLQVNFASGTSVVADYGTQTFYVATKTGKMFEIPFSQAITQA